MTPTSATPDPRPAPTLAPRLGAGAAGLISAGLAASLVLAFPLGLLIAPLGLVPVVHLAARGQPTAAAWSWVLAGLVAIAVFVSNPAAWAVVAAYVGVIVLPAVGVEAWRRAGWSEGRWAAVVTAVGAVGSMALLAALVAPADPVSGSAAHIRAASVTIAELYRDAGIGEGRVDLTLDVVERSMKWVLPSLPLAYLVMVLFWLRARLTVLGFGMAIEPFERYRSDDGLAVAFAVTGIGTLALGGVARWIAVNLLMAVIILYFVHGLAIIRAHLARWVGRGWLVRWGVGLLCLQLPLPIVVAALGVIDSFVGLRPRTSDSGGRP